MKKRGQITAFIIIGLVLLIFAILAFYLMTQLTPSEEEVLPTLTTIQEEAVPVRLYVQDCIQRLGEDALRRLGQHGGYIDPTNSGYTGEDYSFSATDPTNSQGVSLSLTGNNPIVYWYYLESDNECTDCTVDTEMPELDDFAPQLQKYVEDNLDTCLDDFYSFRQQGYEIEKGELNTEVTITEEDVVFYVTYPLILRKEGRELEVTDYLIREAVNLKNIYNAAREIAAAQTDYQFLEQISLFIINAYAGMPKAERIPPVFWYDHEKTYVTWTKPDVKYKIQNYILGTYMNYIQFNGSRDATLLTGETPTQQGLYNSLYINDITPYPDYKINLFFNPLWMIYFDITPPVNGNLIMPTVKTRSFYYDLQEPITDNYYEFYYDLSFPTIVSIQDNTSFNGKGYTFQFALEGNIRDNKDLLTWAEGNGTIGSYNPDDYPPDFEVSITETGNCTNETGTWICNIDRTTYNSESDCTAGCYEEGAETEVHNNVSVTKSLFGEQSQRISDNITIYTYDALTNNPIEGASIIYGCGNYQRASIGTTNSSGILKSKFPICIGDGYIKAMADGYGDGTVYPVSINFRDPQNHTIELQPYRTVELEIKSIHSDILAGYPDISDEDTKQALISTGMPLENDEHAMVTVAQTDYQLGGGTALPTPIVDILPDTTNTIPIIPGNFSIRIDLFKDKSYDIEYEAIDADTGETTTETTTYGPPTLMGGVYLTEESRTVEITNDDIDKGKITLYYIKIPEPETLEDLNDLALVLNYSIELRELFEPEWS